MESDIAPGSTELCLECQRKAVQQKETTRAFSHEHNGLAEWDSISTDIEYLVAVAAELETLLAGPEPKLERAALLGELILQRIPNDDIAKLARRFIFMAKNLGKKGLYGRIRESSIRDSAFKLRMAVTAYKRELTAKGPG